MSHGKKRKRVRFATKPGRHTKKQIQAEPMDDDLQVDAAILNGEKESPQTSSTPRRTTKTCDVQGIYPVYIFNTS